MAIRICGDLVGPSRPSGITSVVLSLHCGWGGGFVFHSDVMWTNSSSRASVTAQYYWFLLWSLDGYRVVIGVCVWVVGCGWFGCFFALVRLWLGDIGRGFGLLFVGSLLFSFFSALD